MNVSNRLRYAAAFARSWLAYYTDGPPRPISAAFAITFRCNLRCGYCNTPFLESPELTVPQIGVVLDRLKSMHVCRIGFAGGEPLIRKDIADIVRITHEREFYVTLNTNLNLYRDNKTVFDDIDLVFTSLDGRKAAHNANRGPKAFEGVLEAIRDLVAEGKRVVAISVITDQNVTELDHLLDIADEIGFKIHLQSHSTGADCTRGPRSDALTNEREREFWRNALRRKRAGRPLVSSTLYLEALGQWEDFGETTRHEEGVRCAGGRGFLYIDPGGNAYPCFYLRSKIRPVNLLSRDWQSSSTPCTRCNFGPHLEFNTLYQKPVRSAFQAMRAYS